MQYFNSKSFNFFLILSVFGVIASCGTAERTLTSKQEPAEKNGSSFPDTSPDQPIENSPLSPPAKTLVIPTEDGVEAVRLIENGSASWYGPNFHGRLTANGERFDMHGMTAAHRTLPFNTLVLVENVNSGKSVLVRINDRGPFAKNRVIDLSKKAAREVGMIGPGVANVNLYIAKKDLPESEATNLKVATYTIQLGSFDKKAQAFNYSSKIKGSRVEIVRKKNKKYYRVYYGLYIDKNEAAQKQKDLERKNINGYVKQIENG